MQQRLTIEEKYKKKINLLKKHNKYYYIDDKPKISDHEYDKLKKEILELEGKYSFLREDTSVVDIIGSKPSNKFSKIRHLRPMLSLSNAFNVADMQDFLKKINNFLNYKNNNLELHSEPKIDGISATLIYEEGKLTKG